MGLADRLAATAAELLRMFPTRLWLAAAVLLLGVVLGVGVGYVVRRLLRRAGVPGAVEGTGFDRTARGLGTTPVDILGKLATYFVVGVAVLAASSVADLEYADRFWTEVVGFLPQFFFAVFVLIVGLAAAEKAELYVSERLSAIKLPDVGVIPVAVKYSILYIFVLVALSQVGVATLALTLLFGAYAFAVVVLAAVAFKQMLASAAAGIYLLLVQPYGIGDEVRIDGRRGIVQEVSLLVTRVEDDGDEYIVPNHLVFQAGVLRVRS